MTLLPTRRRTALYAAANALLTTVAIGALATATGEPLLFPSLGPTAFLLFTRPLHATASPRNTVLGHLVGVLAGATTLIVALGLLRTPAHLATIMVGVVVLTALGAAVNRLAGLPYPLWRSTDLPGDRSRD